MGRAFGPAPPAPCSVPGCGAVL